jgi:cytochrome oxidase Cu insertion factor (SCO1/SenC/PrrC family)
MNKQAGALSPKLILILLSLMFLIPLTLAWLMYSGVIDYRPVSHVNKGMLIEPPVKADLPEKFRHPGLYQHWVLVYPLPSSCSDPCRQILFGLRQFHRALGRDGNRVALVLLAETRPDEQFLEEIEKLDPGFNVISDNTGKLSLQLKQLADGSGIFIIDPLGNIMMNYPPEPDPNDILADMERLLQYAKTDPQ